MLLRDQHNIYLIAGNFWHLFFFFFVRKHVISRHFRSKLKLYFRKRHVEFCSFFLFRFAFIVVFPHHFQSFIIAVASRSLSSTTKKYEKNNKNILKTLMIFDNFHL